MRIVTWNVAHQAAAGKIHQSMHSIIELLQPDVLVLTEYVHAQRLDRQALIASIKSLGLQDPVISKPFPRANGRWENQVLIASRDKLAAGELSGPCISNACQAGFLHVRVGSMHFVGLRVPYWKSDKERKLKWQAYWSELVAKLASLASDRAIVVGDINVDPHSKSCDSVVAPFLARLSDQGWQIPNPEGEWSFYKGSRLDHAFVSPSVRVLRARYAHDLSGVSLGFKGNNISDHAPLLVEIE